MDIRQLLNPERDGGATGSSGAMEYTAAADHVRADADGSSDQEGPTTIQSETALSLVSPAGSSSVDNSRCGRRKSMRFSSVGDNSIGTGKDFLSLFLVVLPNNVASVGRTLVLSRPRCTRIGLRKKSESWSLARGEGRIGQKLRIISQHVLSKVAKIGGMRNITTLPRSRNHGGNRCKEYEKV